jgi:hypothetical protein
MTVNVRIADRHAARFPAVLVMQGFYLDAAALDLSDAGALIEVADVRLVPRNGAGALRLLSDSGRQLVELPVRVVRTAGNRRIGLRFCEASPGARNMLGRLLTSSHPFASHPRREVCAVMQRGNHAHHAMHAAIVMNESACRTM